MRIKQFKDVIKEVADAHQSIAKLCGDLCLKADSERVKMLLAHIEIKQKEAQQHLLLYILQAPKPVLESWVEFAFEHPFELLCKNTAIQADINVDDVISKIAQLEQLLVDMLSTVAQEAASEESRVVFSNLFIAESNRVKSLVHSCHRAEDI